jgi:MFS family permease
VHHAPDDRLARRNALILAAATALAGANSTVIFATAAILGATLASDPAFATLPISVFVVGMAVATLPTGMAARRFGRRAAFLAGSLFGVAAGLVAYCAVMASSFPLLCVATFLGGIYGAVAQSFRFAAADTASAALRPKVISWVLAGGIAAAVLGPQLVQLTMDLHAPYLFSVTYLAQAAVSLLAMATLAFVRIPLPPRGPQASGRPLRVIARQPLFITAVICGVASYGLMNLVMTSAPLAMKMCGHPISASNLAIQWHVLAMYAPSFFTGTLISRFGASRIVALGLVLLAATGVVDLAGVSVAHFWTGMILLGIGWNFGFVGATAMVAGACAPEERNKVQAFNDFLVFGTMAVGSFSSGHVLAASGWGAVNAIVFPPVLVGLAALAWYRFRPQAVAA